MKIKIKRKLKEMSSMGGGAVQGYAGSPLSTKEENEKFNKKQEKEQRLKGQKLAEMYSTQGLAGKNKQQIISGEEEHQGHIERSKHQGLKNVMEADDETATMDFDVQANRPTVLSRFGSNLQEVSPTARKAVQDAGYKFVDYLGGGQFGKVFKVKNPATNREEAMKIVTGTPNSVNREVRNYDLVQQARLKSDVLEKHFPETYASWQQDGFGFIAMEILEPLDNPADALVVDRYNILSRSDDANIDDKEIERGSDKYEDYRDQSKKAIMWYTNKFVDSLRGESQQLEDAALKNLRGAGSLPDIDYSDSLIKMSAASMLGLKGAYETGNLNFADKMAENINFFKNRSGPFQKISRLLTIVESETKNAPYVVTAIAIIAREMVRIRMEAKKAMGFQGLDYAELDEIIFPFLVKYVKGYREYSTMRIGYDKKGPKVAAGTEKETWDKIAKELFDTTGLAARDVHYGNVMQRPSGDLVIVDLGLFKMKGDAPGLFESKKYKLKILRK